MKGSIGLGLLVGIIAAIFLPYVFMFITAISPFDPLINGFNTLASGTPTSLTGLIPIFSGAFIPIVDQYNPLYIWDLIQGTGADFLPFLPPILTWLVCGLLAALFTQSAKKGVLAAIVFVVVEILLYLLFGVLTGSAIMDIIMPGGEIMVFLFGTVITPLGFGIAGGAIGGAISQGAFGPEEF